MNLRVKLISIFLILFQCGLAQNPINLVKQNLEVENSTAANFFLKSIPPSIEKSLLQIEVSILEDNYENAQQSILDIENTKLSNCEKIKFHLFKAVIQSKQFNYTESENQFHIAQNMLKDCPSSKIDLAALNYWAGYTFLTQQKLVLAEQNIIRAIKYFGQDSARYYVKNAKLFFWFGTLKHEQQEYDSAIFWLKKSLRIFLNTPLDKTQETVKVYNNLGNAYSEKWDYLNSISNYEKAIKLNRKNGTPSSDLIFAYANLAQFYDKFDNYIKSENNYAIAFDLMKDVDVPSIKKALILQNYGTALLKKYDYSHALNYYYESLKLITPFQKDHGDIYCRIVINILNAYSFMDRKEDGSFLNQQLSSFMIENKDKWPDQFKNWNLLQVDDLMMKGDLDISYNILTDLETSTSKSDPNFYQILQKKADCLFLQKKFEESIFYNKKIFESKKELLPLSHSDLIYSLNELGQAHFENYHIDSAIHYFLQAKMNNFLKVDKKLVGDLYSSKIEWIVSNFNLLKIAIYTFRKDKGSLINLIQSENLIYTTLSVFDSKRIEYRNETDIINLNRMTHDFFDVAMEYYFILYKETGNKEYIDKAFFISEKTKYQALHQSMKLDRVNAFAGVTNRVLQEENNLAKQMSQLEYQYSQELARQEEPLPELVEEYITGWKANSTRYDKLIDSIQNNLPDYYNLKFNKAAVEISQIQTDLLSKDHNTAWVSYYFGAETCYAIVISSTEKHFINLGSSENIARLTKSFNNYVTHQVGEESYPTSDELYKKLLHPIDSSINRTKKIKKIVIIPDDVLNYLNFELLTKPGQKDRHYALFDYQFSYGYSSTLLWAEFSQQLKWNSSDLNMVGFAPEFIAQNKFTGEVSREGSENSNYDSFDFSPLSKNQEEVQQVSEILKHKKAKTSLYLGLKADESSFKKADFSNVNIIHLATHGFVSNNQKGVAGIAFAKKEGSADDGILYMDEIFSLRNKANLVCLSACETGGGILNNGEGLLGLTRAFIYSGSQNLVVSLWKVQDESTAQLMKTFYSNLVKKQSIAASLRSAKLEMIKKNPTVHPYYWSAFIHIGLN